MAYLTKLSTHHRSILATAWASDPLHKTNFTDLFPFPDDAEGWERLPQSHDVMPFLYTADDYPAVFHWAHDIGVTTTGMHAWIGTYVLPEFRGRACAHMRQATFDTMVQYFKTQSIEQLFGAVRITNHGARKYARKMGWQPIGVYSDWGIFGGELDDAEIFTLRLQDQALAWVVAEQRAMAFRAMPH